MTAETLKNELMLTQASVTKLEKSIAACRKRLSESETQHTLHREALAEFKEQLSFMRNRALVVKIFHFRDVRDMHADSVRIVNLYSQEIAHCEAETLKYVEELKTLQQDIAILQNEIADYGQVLEFAQNDQ